MTRLKTQVRQQAPKPPRRSFADRGAYLSDSQRTLRETVVLNGVGVHSNKPAQLAIHPAEAGAGVSFYRSDLTGDAGAIAPALWSQVCGAELCTTLRVGAQSVATIEHVMAALAGVGVDNALVEIDGPEAPVFDGSASAFVEAIDEAGLRNQA